MQNLTYLKDSRLTMADKKFWTPEELKDREAVVKAGKESQEKRTSARETFMICIESERFMGNDRQFHFGHEPASAEV